MVSSSQMEAGACLDDAAIARLLADEVSPDERRSMLEHADGCEDCRELLAAVLQPGVERTGIGSRSGVGDETTLPASVPSGRVVKLSAGDVIDHYTIVAPLGQGAMGVVMRARDTVLGRDVALKLVVRTGSEESERRLVREAQAMAQLSHPHVVTVHAVGTYAQGVYIAMELVPGQTLRAWQEQDGRGWTEILGAYLAAGRGLAAAHAVGLIHRDFKPDNVLVRDDGQVLVTDFGLAAVAKPWMSTHDEAGLELSADLTATGAMMGTPRFMAPEQHRGSRTLDARADQFSFAVALYAALYGRYPFTGNSIAALQQSVSGGTPLQPVAHGDIPRAIWVALQRCLQREPDDRYPDMRTLLRALEEVLEAPVRRRRRAALGLVGAAMLTGGVVLGSYGLQPEARPCQHLGERLEGVWDEARADAVAASLAAARDTEAAEQTVVRVQARLDDYAGRWVAMAERLCEATHVHGVQPEATLEARMRCLDERRAALGALGDGLMTRTADEVIDRAVPATLSLPAIEPCAEREPGLPAVPTVIEGELAQLYTLLQLGAYQEVADRIERRLSGIDSPRARARLLLTAARANKHLHRNDEAVAMFTEAGLAGAEVGDDHLVATVQVELMQLLTIGQERYAMAEVLANNARISLRRVGDPLRLRITLGLNEAAVARSRLALREALAALKRIDEALPEVEHALELRREHLGDRHPVIAATLLTTARMMLMSGRHEEAEGYLERSLHLIEAHSGHNALPAAEVIHMQASAALDAGTVDLGTERAVRALAVLEANGQGDSQHAFSVRTLIGVGYSMQGRHEDARREIAKTVAARERVGGTDDPAFAFDLHIYAEALSRGQHCDEAIPVYERLLGILEPDAAMFGSTSGGLALCKARRGLPGAREALEQALALEGGARLEDFDRASITFGLAKLVAALEPAHALSLAESALALLHDADGEPLKADVEAWLAERRGGPAGR